MNKIKIICLLFMLCLSCKKVDEKITDNHLVCSAIFVSNNEDCENISFKINYDFKNKYVFENNKVGIYSPEVNKDYNGFILSLTNGKTFALSTLFLGKNFKLINKGDFYLNLLCNEEDDYIKLLSESMIMYRKNNKILFEIPLKRSELKHKRIIIN